MQKLEGDGLCFVHAGGNIQHFELAAGQSLRVDTGCLVALQPSVHYDIQFVGGIKTALFGGEGIFFATLQGPGRVWLQSLPLSRMADRIYSSAPQNKGWRKEEGSILDRVGGLGRPHRRPLKAQRDHQGHRRHRCLRGLFLARLEAL